MTSPVTGQSRAPVPNPDSCRGNAMWHWILETPFFRSLAPSGGDRNAGAPCQLSVLSGHHPQPLASMQGCHHWIGKDGVSPRSSFSVFFPSPFFSFWYSHTKAGLLVFPCFL